MHVPELGEQYADHRAQAHALELGMWLFLASEILLFAALFTLYAAYRAMFPDDFIQAIRHNTLAYGTANMYILLTSSLTAALSLCAVRRNRQRLTAGLLAATAAMGVAFLVVKGFEYADHFHHGLSPGPYYRSLDLPTFGANRFYTLYWVMTGFHALHVTLGIGVMVFMTAHALAGRYSADHHTRLEMGTLYWHLVDLVWIFLWPLLYLS